MNHLSKEEEFILEAVTDDDLWPDEPVAAKSRIDAFFGAQGSEKPKMKKKSKKYGDKTQYSMTGKGFTPCTTTRPLLPAGIYGIEWIDGVGLTFMPKAVITDNLLRLPDSKSDLVISEIEKFWTMKEEMIKYQFLHKRGFLLYGPPGSGKTSTCAVVMQQMVKSGGIVLMGNCSPNLLSSALAYLREVEADRPAVVIMEDLDSIIDQYGESEVLAVLDGESSVDNVVFIATTNYPEDLDGRIKDRPSRFDRVVEIGMPNPAARLLYLASRRIEGEDLDKWVELSEGFSIAHLKELIVGVKIFKDKLEDVVARLRSMSKVVSSEKKGKVGFGG